MKRKKDRSKDRDHNSDAEHSQKQETGLGQRKIKSKWNMDAERSEDDCLDARRVEHKKKHKKKKFASEDILPEESLTSEVQLSDEPKHRRNKERVESPKDPSFEVGHSELSKKHKKKKKRKSCESQSDNSQDPGAEQSERKEKRRKKPALTEAVSEEPLDFEAELAERKSLEAISAGVSVDQHLPTEAGHAELKSLQKKKKKRDMLANVVASVEHVANTDHGNEKKSKSKRSDDAESFNEATHQSKKKVVSSVTEPDALPLGATDVPCRPVTLGQWSTADLGDQQRQNKFLKLMGGFKATSAKPDSTSILKSNTALDRDHETKLNRELEQEFVKAQQITFVSRGLGLGFTDRSGALDTSVRSKRFDD